jgi:acetyl esterase/lipase
MNRYFALMGVLMMLTTAAFAKARPDGEVQPDRIVEYKTIGDIVLTLHIFNPPDHKPTDRTAAIVFFFGGAWVNGAPSHFYKQSEYLASRGMVAICADYRTRSKHQTSPMECLKDGKSAMRWVRSHAGELGIDPDRLAAGGGSAGGHIAAATGTTKGLNEEGEDTSVICRPNALVLFNPVIDTGPDSFGYKRVQEYWEDFSPMHNIDSETPPTILFLGTKDEIIPVATAEEFKARMEKAGVRCDLRLYEGQPHGFFNRARYYETLLEADKFLMSLGYLSGEPTLRRE